MVKKIKKQPIGLLPWVIGVGGLVLLSAGGGIFFATRKPSPMELTEIINVLPAATEVVLAVDIQPKSWEFLQKFGSPDARKLLQRSVGQSPFHSLLRQTGMDIQRDVQPWSRGIVCAALVANGDSSSTLLIAPTYNQGAASQFLERYRRALGHGFTQQTYEGITYYQSNVAANAPGDRVDVTAQIGNQYAVISTSPQALFQLIDTIQNRKPALAKQSAFMTNDSKSENKPLIQGFLQGSATLSLLQNDKPQTEQPQNEALTSQEPDFITFSLSSAKQGVQMEVTTQLKTAVKQPIGNKTSTLNSLLPNDTFFFLSGFQIGQSWNFLEQQVQGNSDASSNLDRLRAGIENASQLNLKADIFSWMNGEFTIAAIPSQSGITGKVAGFGLVFLAEADRAKSVQFFNQLDRLAETSDGAILPKGVTITTEANRTLWQVGKSLAAAHGWLANNTIAYWAMGDLGTKINSSKLAESSVFQKLMNGVTSENGGYFYLDMTKGREIFEQKIAPDDWKSQEWFKESMLILQGIEGIVVTQSVVNDRVSRLDGFVTLVPANR